MLFFIKFVVSTLMEGFIVKLFFKKMSTYRIFLIVFGLNALTQPIFAFIFHQLVYPNLIYYIILSEMLIMLTESILFMYAAQAQWKPSLLALISANLASWQLTPLLIAILHLR
ncbi:MAG: hypothetical protein ACQESG_06335 [Nanobdellota archaeon]